MVGSPPTWSSRPAASGLWSQLSRGLGSRGGDSTGGDTSARAPSPWGGGPISKSEAGGEPGEPATGLAPGPGGTPGALLSLPGPPGSGAWGPSSGWGEAGNWARLGAWGSGPGGSKPGDPGLAGPLAFNPGGTAAGDAPGRAPTQRPAASKARASTSAKGQKLAAMDAGQNRGQGNCPCRLRRQSSRQRRTSSAPTATRSAARSDQGLR